MSKFIGYILLFVFLILLVSWICMLLWNWLMPTIFGLPTIDLWQALGLMLLSSCFFYRNK